MEASVRSFIRQNFIFAGEKELGREESLLGRGIVDSTGVLELIGFIEQEFGVTLKDEELIPENLDSVANIVSFLERRLSVSPGACETLRGSQPQGPAGSTVGAPASTR